MPPRHLKDGENSPPYHICMYVRVARMILAVSNVVWNGNTLLSIAILLLRLYSASFLRSFGAECEQREKDCMCVVVYRVGAG